MNHDMQTMLNELHISNVCMLVTGRKALQTSELFVFKISNAAKWEYWEVSKEGRRESKSTREILLPDKDLWAWE